MDSIDVQLLILSILVVIMFLATGLAIALRSIGLISLFITLGLILMSYGLRLKKIRK